MAHEKSFVGTTEFFLFLIMIGSAAVALFIPSEPMSYVIIMLAGFACGRLIYKRRYQEHYPKPDLPYFIVSEFTYLIMILAFLIGYIMGSYRVSKVMVLILFLVSFAISYYVHYKKIYVYA